MKANLILGLVKSQLEGDQNTFNKIALQIAAKEATAGHNRVAHELREMIEKFGKKTTDGQHIGKNVPIVPITRPNGELSALLKASYPNERFQDMVLDDPTHNILSRILKEQTHRQQFAAYGLSPRRKFLLVGPPGCGKTMTARMLAGELSRPLFIVRLEGLLSRYLGETSAHLSTIFDAMEKTTGVYLFDEFDSIGTYRGDSRDIGEVRRVLSSFLQMIENDTSESIIIAATNYEHVLDDALFRRFDDVIEFDIPSVSLLEKFLMKNLTFVEVIQNFPWGDLAEMARGLSFAELSRAISDAIKIMLMLDKNVLEPLNLEQTIGERISIRNRIHTRNELER